MASGGKVCAVDPLDCPHHHAYLSENDCVSQRLEHCSRRLRSIPTSNWSTFIPSASWFPLHSSRTVGTSLGLRYDPMHPELRRAYEAEMTTAISRYDAGDLSVAFAHLERAHILGQSFSITHARTHWWMLKVGLRNRDIVEIAGQIPRILGALLFSRIWVPIGNTGGARVPPFKPMPIPYELQALLDQYGRKANQ